MIPPRATPPTCEAIIEDVFVRLTHYVTDGSGSFERGIAIVVSDGNRARTPQQARMIAAALVQLADEFERWERSFR